MLVSTTGPVVLVACSDSGSGAARDGGPDNSEGGPDSSTEGGGGAGGGGPCFGGPPPAPQITTVPYRPKCEDAGTDAAAPDASGDDASTSDASTASCEDTQTEICQRHCSDTIAVSANPNGCMIQRSDAGMPIAVQCTQMVFCGRRFAELREPPPGADVLASAVYLEAASVHSFRRMAREIDAHDLGSHLSRWARRSAREEARHARLMMRLARRAGVRHFPRVERPAPRVRSLEEIAIENAIEGCIRETFGALLAMREAGRAADDEARATLTEIARDETSHAALAWALSDALSRKLDAPARARVLRARRAEVASMQAQLATDATVVERRLFTRMIDALVDSEHGGGDPATSGV